MEKSFSSHKLKILYRRDGSGENSDGEKSERGHLLCCGTFDIGTAGMQAAG